MINDLFNKLREIQQINLYILNYQGWQEHILKYSISP